MRSARPSGRARTRSGYFTAWTQPFELDTSRAFIYPTDTYGGLDAFQTSRDIV